MENRVYTIPADSPSAHGTIRVQKLIFPVFAIMIFLFALIIVICHGTILQSSKRPLVFYALPALLSTKSTETTVNCDRYGFPAFPNETNVIYDLFLFNNELDQLEIRLYELYEYVTFFIIVESTLTFTGKPKPLYLKENWARFSRYHDKIRRIEVKLVPSTNNQLNPWDNERQMRTDSIKLGVPESARDFILLTSDLDEIPKARFIQALATCKLPDSFKPLAMECDFYYYSYEFRHATNPNWLGGSVTRHRSNNEIPADLRRLRFSYRRVPNSCFHCSSCFDRIETVRQKISSFSHKEFDIPRFHDQVHIIDCFRNGKDLFDRASETYKRVKINENEIPRLLRVESQRFRYMLNRSWATAGFVDV